jgi:hypothetical protein
MCDLLSQRPEPLPKEGVFFLRGFLNKEKKRILNKERKRKREKEDF